MILRLLLLFAILSAISCSDSDEYYFETSNGVEITMNVSISHTFDNSVDFVKADTFNINDSIVLQVNVQPSKSIKMKSYRWLLDGKPYKSDFSFKDRFTTPGHHKLTFEMEDYYGDMHYDSLDIWTAPPPELDVIHFLPANGTQEISTLGGTSFAWEAHTEGIDLKHYYHFTLSEKAYSNTGMSFKMVDTILHEPTHMLYKPLPALREYIWTVQACNEYKLCSEKTISSSFFTGATLKEGSVQGSFTTTSNQDIPVSVSLTPLSDDSLNIRSYKFNISEILGDFSFGPLPSGSYRLSYDSKYPDFGSGSQVIEIRDRNITLIDPIAFNDTISPSISAVGYSDTLDYADTLKFIITDGGLPLSPQRIFAQIEDRTIITKSFANDTLTLILSDIDKYWNYQPVAIKAVDANGNITSKTFYLSPGRLWFSSNSDTTLYIGDSLLIYFQDMNPYGFSVDSFWIDNFTQGYSLILTKEDLIAADANKKFESTFIPPCSSASTQELVSTVIYENGFHQVKKWHIQFLERED